MKILIADDDPQLVRALRITLGGADLTRLSAARRARAGLGHCLEDRHIFPGMTVEENLELGQLCASRDRPALKVEEIYDIFPELGERPKLQAGKLSGGQQQFLAIGRALAGSPTVLMLDEPTNGLAPILIERVVGVILDKMTVALEEGGRVELRGFGAFSVRSRPARAGRNPRTGEPVSVKGKHVPFFKSGKELRERLNAD